MVDSSFPKFCHVAGAAVNLHPPRARPRRRKNTVKIPGSRWTAERTQSAPHSLSCVERAQASVLVDGQLAALCSAACEGFR